MRLFTVLMAVVLLWGAVGAQGKKPAVLFTSGLHQGYFTKPLHAEGIELHSCRANDLPELLPTGDYNVVVVTGGAENPAVVTAL
ncbi:MAG TPA: hypothetical protein PLZ36_08945, partial [Armatimonadota bacterium]|nr:hypothetical protein [Armatimonadota bacterium]